MLQGILSLRVVALVRCGDIYSVGVLNELLERAKQSANIVLLNKGCGFCCVDVEDAINVCCVDISALRSKPIGDTSATYNGDAKYRLALGT